MRNTIHGIHTVKIYKEYIQKSQKIIRRVSYKTKSIRLGRLLWLHLLVSHELFLPKIFTFLKMVKTNAVTKNPRSSTDSPHLELIFLRYNRL